MKIEMTMKQAGRVFVGAMALVLMAALMTACGGKKEAPAERAAETYLPPSVPESHLMADDSDADAEAEVEEPDVVALLREDSLVDMSEVVPKDQWAMTEEEVDAVVSDWLREMESEGMVQVARPGESLPLPEDFPTDIEMPHGLEIRAMQINEEENRLVLQGGSPQSMNELTEFFLTKGYENDWTIGEQTQQASPLEQMRMLRLQKDDRHIELNLIESDRFTETQVTMTLRGQ